MSDLCYFQALAPLEHHPSGTHWLITCKGTADAATNFLLEPTSIVSRNLRVNPHMFIKFHHISPIPSINHYYPPLTTINHGNLPYHVFKCQTNMFEVDQRWQPCCCLHRCHAHHNRTDHDLCWAAERFPLPMFFQMQCGEPSLVFPVQVSGNGHKWGGLDRS